VRINETRRDDLATSVDFLCASACNAPDRDDAVAGDAHIGLERRSSRAVNDKAAANDQRQIVSHDLVSFLDLWQG
jgi:hypothetical protein